MNIKNNEPFTCPICLVDIKKKEDKAVTECGHKFCWNCMEKMENKYIQDGTFSKFKCPVCRTPLVGEMNDLDIKHMFEDMGSSGEIYFLIKWGGSVIKLTMKNKK